MTGVRATTLQLIGTKFGRWTVTGYAGTRAFGKEGRSRAPYMECKCDCGAEGLIMMRTLITGASRSCGCLQKEIVSEARRTHGESGGGGRKRSHLYSVWANMMQRCYNPKTEHYQYYGGKGIKVHQEWHQFEKFKEYMESLPNELSIDRINGSKDYAPGNVRWATHTEQMQNTSRSKPFIPTDD